MSDDVEMNTKGLDQFLKALEKAPVGRVGVLGDKNIRSKGIANSNATIGAKHEFGSSEAPQRSFLRMPISEKLQTYLERANAFDVEAFKKVIASGSIKVWTQKVCIIAEQIVGDAFDTGGFGKWKPSNMLFKKNHQTLVETQQLRNSITSDVKE